MVSVGADIVDIDEVGGAVASFGDRYVQRLFSRAEVEMCGPVPPAVRTAWLAQCFAAKEAGLKLLRSLGARLPKPVRDAGDLAVDGMGTVDGVLDWRWIEVVRSRSGGLELRFDGQARRAARAAGVTRVMVSVATTGKQAMAVAVAWPSHACIPGVEDASTGAGDFGASATPGCTELGPTSGSGADIDRKAEIDSDGGSFDRRQNP